ncbi:1-phosphatidylinositol-3-phosphate 5-kinase FAB1B [Dissostichus eleginoides]|uniref:1-phosphatidylinositol-3-phosphate 5-kinase FAB1B n=1 Tax=Dissostichus eleginoides TaxID=100907 RepID=A0AAD9B7U1_DISEL|nr:1-phosphatidylinositol-3-phosphate 5-kinase FAB1B [Dissostichus eleginoides]
MDSPSKFSGLNDDEVEALRGEGQLFIYSILDEALPRRDLYSRGIRVFWSCLDFLVRQVRLQRVFQQKAAREKEVNKVLNRKLEEALRLIEVLQATGSFEQDGKYLLFKSQMFDCDSIVMFNYL